MSNINEEIALPPKGKSKNRIAELANFAQKLEGINKNIGFKVSARGWCYQLENLRLINKDEFSRVQDLINECRELGLLPIDFVADEEGRQFEGVSHPTKATPLEHIRDYIYYVPDCYRTYTPDWWEGEPYYIQMIVEKIDLKTLFASVCYQYRIPIATAKGWSSMLQRAEYAQRFKDFESKGLQCVLLYCGDHDPDGLRISDFLRTNLAQLKDIRYSDGRTGYDPQNLIIERFGLDYAFIQANHLTWIDNLITGSKKNLADPTHKNYHQKYLQEYLQNYGERKCEANALVIQPAQGRALCVAAIEKYLTHDIITRIQDKKDKIKEIFTGLLNQPKISKIIATSIKEIDAMIEKSEDDSIDDEILDSTSESETNVSENLEDHDSEKTNPENLEDHDSEKTNPENLEDHDSEKTDPENLEDEPEDLSDIAKDEDMNDIDSELKKREDEDK